MTKTFIVASAAAFMATSALAAPTYVTGSWARDAIIILDENFQELSSFATGATDPNGVDSDGTLLFSGHFTSSELRAFDTAGNFQYNFGIPENTQGLAIVGNEVAVASSGTTFFYDIVTGVETRTFANSGGTVEGLTVHNNLLWEIGATIIGRNTITGAEVVNIANAASNCGFGGTGIASAGANELALSCTDGGWFRVSDSTGAIIASGNNGLDMYGLGDFVRGIPAIPAPGALGLLGLGVMMLAARRRKTA